jgi:hypothetical protein
MHAAQTTPRAPADRPQHLRLTVQIEDGRLDLLDALVVNDPLDPPRRTVGLWVYQWREGDDTVWWDTMPDPLTQRSIARPKEFEHSFGRLRRGDFTVRVPVDRHGATQRLELRVYRSAAALTEDPAALADLVAARGTQLELVATLGDEAFKRHPQWARVEAALDIVRRE